MKELKLAKGDVFDQDAVVSYLEMKATEPLWKEPFKAIGELCSKEIAAKKDEILKEFEKAPFNVKKEQCNAVYNYMMHCVTFEAFKVSLRSFQRKISSIFSSQKCPKASWTEDKRCASSKAWMEKCDNMSIIKQLFAKFGIWWLEPFMLAEFVFTFFGKNKDRKHRTDFSLLIASKTFDFRNHPNAEHSRVAAGCLSRDCDLALLQGYHSMLSSINSVNGCLWPHKHSPHYSSSVQNSFLCFSFGGKFKNAIDKKFPWNESLNEYKRLCGWAQCYQSISNQLQSQWRIQKQSHAEVNRCPLHRWSSKLSNFRCGWVGTYSPQ